MTKYTITFPMSHILDDSIVIQGKTPIDAVRQHYKNANVRRAGYNENPDVIIYEYVDKRHLKGRAHCYMLERTLNNVE